jgi:hypothetical protein
MNTPQQLKKHNPRYTLIQKLDPIRFPQMSGVMAALVGYVVGATFIEPTIAEIAVTSDGFVLARPEGHVGAAQFLGRYADLLRKWLRLIAAARLTNAEFMEAQALFAAKIGFFGQATA